MPLYELFCLARPGLGRAAHRELMRTTAAAVTGGDGVLTGLCSYGERPLAYEFRRPGLRFTEAFMWQLNFAVKPEVLGEVEHVLKVDDKVLRYVIVRKKAWPRYPTAYRVSQLAESLLRAEGLRSAGQNGPDGELAAAAGAPGEEPGPGGA